MREPHGQADSIVRFDWGPTGALAIAQGAAVVLVVDVLSFTTTVTVAAEAGIEVFPYRMRDATASTFAATKQAVLAVGRLEAGSSGVSLSPLSVKAATEPGGPLSKGGRLVLPSPNGSTIARALLEQGVTVVAACLRNATAAALWARREAAGAPIGVVAAGERWPGDTLRPAVEDLWGAGAVIAALSGRTSPEADAAAAAFRAVSRSLPESIAACASGRELVADGHGDELPIASAVNAGTVVPVLRSESFQPA